MGIRDKPIAAGSPWQNGFAERLIGSIRRECTDHVVAFGEAHPKGPSKELINAIVELKRRNPRVGCPRIAQEIVHTFGIDIDKDIVRRVGGWGSWTLIELFAWRQTQKLEHFSAT